MGLDGGSGSLLERRAVSRKTPGDGRLEIAPASAARLRLTGATIEVEYAGRRAPGRLETMACSCAKAGGPHEHHFVSSELLKALRPGIDVDLRVEGTPAARGVVRVMVTPVLDGDREATE
jgi:hypothetical protein